MLLRAASILLALLAADSAYATTCPTPADDFPLITWNSQQGIRGGADCGHIIDGSPPMCDRFERFDVAARSANVRRYQTMLSLSADNGLSIGGSLRIAQLDFVNNLTLIPGSVSFEYVSTVENVTASAKVMLEVRHSDGTLLASYPVTGASDQLSIEWRSGGDGAGTVQQGIVGWSYNGAYGTLFNEFGGFDFLDFRIGRVAGGCDYPGAELNFVGSSIFSDYDSVSDQPRE